MKALNEAELKEIVYNCRKATFLIEKQQIGKITMKEKVELKIHLAGCAICVTFMQQSAVINQMARKIFGLAQSELKLTEEFKKQFQQQIDNHLDKN